MAEEYILASGTKSEQYESMLKQIRELVAGESDMIANMANICAMLSEQFRWLWVGFYIVKEEELVLGPFQGPIACTRIRKGRGVCGKAWESGSSLIVDDVHTFPGHIACSSRSNSEIVIPVFKRNGIIAVLDVDSESFKEFDETDRDYLQQIVRFLDASE